MMARTEKPETVVHKDHSVITPPTTLRDRAMSIGTGTKDGFDVAALERAEQALAELESDFSTWMGDEVVKLEGARVAFRAAPSDKDVQQTLYRASHDIRGHGKTFGFPLAGEIADGLCDLLDGAPETDRQVVELADAHVDAIRAVVRDNVQNEQDVLARKVIAGLRNAREAIIGVDRFIKINADVY